AWKLPLRRGRMWRTCVHSPWMQGESAVNAVAMPTEAPTWPPWVASRAGAAQLSGAHEPGVLGSQPESPVPQASTVPPPVTRQPPGKHSGGGLVFGPHCPVLVLHSLQLGLSQLCCWCVCTQTPWLLAPPASQPAVVQLLPSVSVQGVLVSGVKSHWPLVVLQTALVQ